MKIGHVYKLVCKDVTATEIYVGSSSSLRNRRANHKSACSNENWKSYNLPVYQYIRANGGWDNWQLLPIERVEFDFKFELHDRERHHMEALHATLNSRVPNRTQAEHRQYHQQYMQQRQEESSKKHDCPCGGRYTNEHKSTHLKTERHQNYELGKQMYEARFGHAWTRENNLKKEKKRTPKAAGVFFFALFWLLVLSVWLNFLLKATQNNSIKKHDSNFEPNSNLKKTKVTLI